MPGRRRRARGVYSQIVMSEPVTVEKFAVGQSVRRVEDPHLLQGLGRYSDDVSLPRQAYAAPRPALARERVRHVGDPVALVVAETREQAADAAALVAVEYEPLPAVT